MQTVCLSYVKKCDFFFRCSSCYLSRGQFITHCFVHAIKSFNWVAIHLCHENVPCDVEAIILLGQCSTLQSKRKRCVKFCKASHKAHWPFLKEAFFQDAMIPETSVFGLKCSLQLLLGIPLHFIYNIIELCKCCIALLYYINF